MTSWNGLLKLPTLIFAKTQKVLWIKESKMFNWWATKEKNFWTYLATSKVVPGNFWDRAKRAKRIFDHALAKCFLSALAVFLAIYQSQSKNSRLMLQKKLFFVFLKNFIGWSSTV